MIFVLGISFLMSIISFNYNLIMNTLLEGIPPIRGTSWTWILMIRTSPSKHFTLKKRFTEMFTVPRYDLVTSWCMYIMSNKVVFLQHCNLSLQASCCLSSFYFIDWKITVEKIKYMHSAHGNQGYISLIFIFSKLLPWKKE